MAKKESTPDFEQSLAELETLVEQMESGELTLEKSLAQFERGMELTKTCQEALNAAQLRVDTLLEQPADEGAGPLEDSD
ncbi:MAG: exodeoxyribonuclease VII small subunit [Pseudomonadota bacterium]